MEEAWLGENQQEWLLFDRLLSQGTALVGLLAPGLPDSTGWELVLGYLAIGGGATLG